jgi:mono/diheme cytochrome c family protein
MAARLNPDHDFVKESLGTMRLVSSLVFVACSLLLGTGAYAQNPGGSLEGKKLKNPVASSAASIAAGQQTFQKMCAFCHGKDATGNGPMAPKGTTPSNLTDATWDRGDTDGEIFLVLQAGAGPKFEMKGYKGKIPDAELWNIVNYLRSLSSRGKTP